MPDVAFRPHPGPQTSAYTCFAREMLYGGARGGGKTALAVGKFHPLAAKFGHEAVGVVFRRSFPELEQVKREGIKQYVRTGWAKWVGGDQKMFKFHNGAELRLRYLSSFDDCENYQGHEYCYICFDEAGNFTDHRMFEELRATLRSPGVPDKFWQILYTANPGGRQHHWLRKYFAVGRYPDGGQWLRDKFGRTRIFYPARVTDNPSVAGTDYENELKAIRDPAKRAAWLEGSWDVVVGAFFADCWIPKKHIITADRSPPRHWPKFRAMDWGSAKPFCVLWYVVTSDDEEWCGRWWPRGAVVFFREWYGCARGEFDVGIRLTAEEVGAGIVERETRWGLRGLVQPGPGDTAMWTRDGGPSIYDRIFEGGQEQIHFTKAYKDRITGWEEIRTRLVGIPGELDDEGNPGERIPMLYFDRRCENSIRTLPILERSDRNMEDVDTEQEDHAADVIRYVCNDFRRPVQSVDEWERMNAPQSDERWRQENAFDEDFGY